jgi:ubiquinol-cytochrome c reductase cytochrome b subunit
VSRARRVGDWLDERTGHRALLGRLLDEHVPGGARWAYVWGSALTLSLAAQAITGWLLMSAYAPSASTAWASVAHVHFTMRAGWLVRGIHHFGAQAMVVLLAAHLVQTAIYGAYRRPREVNWYLGLGLLLVTLAFALTGYLLPWDQKGYWATRVATGILGSVPLVGRALEELVVGGPAYGHLTLTRFYALHVGVLPAAALLLLAAHLALFRRHGVTPPVGADVTKVDRFYPGQAARDVAVGLAVLVAIFALAGALHGAPLDAPADPASDYPARPEWYFLPLFELLKYLPGALEPVGAVGVPLLALAYLVALPLVDVGPDRRLRARAGLLAPLGAIGACALLLGLLAARADANDPGYASARAVADQRAARAAELFRRGVPPEGPLAMMRRDPETRGPELFAERCAVCHALGDQKARGDKAAGPDLTGFGARAWVLGVLDDPDAAHRFGRTPFKGMMPSMTRPPEDPEAAKMWTPLVPADREAIAAFLEAEAGGRGGRGMPGEALVRRRCTGCHRLDGKTDDDSSLAPELRGWASARWIEAQIEDPGSGKAYPAGATATGLAGHMPGFTETMPEADRKVLAAWLAARPR